METQQHHDLHDFMKQLQDEMSAEYERIRRRARQDPGTAGDEGEENWAELLRGWLPSNYSVTTKGRIIGHDGRTSGQMDVIVLKGTYTKRLVTKKMYLAAGVAAAFECKTTLRADHIAKAIETCANLKRLYPDRRGSPYKELHSPVIYGLLAHSHSWKSERSMPEQVIMERLLLADVQQVPHPRLGLDLLCVADLSTWESSKLTFLNPQYLPIDTHEIIRNHWDGGAASTFYVMQSDGDTIQHPSTPIGAFISHLIRKLAWEDPTLRDISDYFRSTHVGGLGSADNARQWDSSIYSEQIRSRVEAGSLVNGEPWNEWSIFFQ